MSLRSAPVPTPQPTPNLGRLHSVLHIGLQHFQRTPVPIGAPDGGSKRPRDDAPRKSTDEVLESVKTRLKESSDDARAELSKASTELLYHAEKLEKEKKELKESHHKVGKDEFAIERLKVVVEAIEELEAWMVIREYDAMKRNVFRGYYADELLRISEKLELLNDERLASGRMPDSGRMMLVTVKVQDEEVPAFNVFGLSMNFNFIQEAKQFPIPIRVVKKDATQYEIVKAYGFWHHYGGLSGKFVWMDGVDPSRQPSMPVYR